jgi:FKBP-type peptidyl-prolyl cis-trans isomerase SlyD
MKIESGCLVGLEYQLFDKDGELVEGGDEDGRIEYLHGHEEIQPTLERALEGAAAGSQLRVELPEGEAFGPYDPEQIVVVPRSEFPPDAEIVPGDWIELALEPQEAAEQGIDEDEGVEMRVVDVRPDAIYLDANHPLAGQSVTFEVKVLSVRRATEAEIAERAAEDAEAGD